MELCQQTDGKMVHFLQVPTLVAGFLQQSLGAMQEFVERVRLKSILPPHDWLTPPTLSIPDSQTIS
jgi:hypothetical protein